MTFTLLALVVSLATGQTFPIHGSQPFDTKEACLEYVQTNKDDLEKQLIVVVDNDKNIPDGSWNYTVTCEPLPQQKGDAWSLLGKTLSEMNQRGFPGSATNPLGE